MTVRRHAVLRDLEVSAHSTTPPADRLTCLHRRVLDLSRDLTKRLLLHFSYPDGRQILRIIQGAHTPCRRYHYFRMKYKVCVLINTATDLNYLQLGQRDDEAVAERFYAKHEIRDG